MNTRQTAGIAHVPRGYLLLTSRARASAAACATWYRAQLSKRLVSEVEPDRISVSGSRSLSMAPYGIAGAGGSACTNGCGTGEDGGTDRALPSTPREADETEGDRSS